MRKLFLLAILVVAAFIWACSNKDINHNPPEVITVGVTPAVNTTNFGDSVRFFAQVYNTTSRAVTWSVNNIPDGTDSLGHIIAINDTSAWYIAPMLGAEVTFDSVLVKAKSVADTSKSGAATARITSPNLVFVDSANGDDATGIGSIFHPYRTITKGISEAGTNDTITVRPGTYATAIGETFPLVIPLSITIKGAGIDSTRVIAPAYTSFAQAAFQLRNNHSTLKDLSILGTTASGIGIHASSAFEDSAVILVIENCQVESCYAAIAVSADSCSNIAIRDNRFANCTYGAIVANKRGLAIDRTEFSNIDSAAVLVDSAGYLTLNDNLMEDCLYGVKINPNGYVELFRDTLANITNAGVYIDSAARALLGGTFPQGDNVFRNFAAGSWCVYNLDDDSVYAIGNTWPAADSITIDTLYIYDDDENATSGAVNFSPFNF